MSRPSRQTAAAFGVEISAEDTLRLEGTTGDDGLFVNDHDRELNISGGEPIDYANLERLVINTHEGDDQVTFTMRAGGSLVLEYDGGPDAGLNPIRDGLRIFGSDADDRAIVLDLGAPLPSDPPVPAGAETLYVGQIAGANVLVKGSLFDLGGALQAVIQVIETETTYIKAAVSEEQGRNESLMRFSDRLASALSKGIVSAFPLKGRIAEIKGEEILVDFGQNVGASEGMQFKVLPDKEEAAQKRKAFIGILTLSQVLERNSVARLDAKYDVIREGQRIVELSPKGEG